MAPPHPVVEAFPQLNCVACGVIIQKHMNLLKAFSLHELCINIGGGNVRMERCK